MTSDLKSFAQFVGIKTKSITERAVAFLFYRAQMSDIPEASVKEISEDFKLVGFPTPNPTRLKLALNKDKRTIKVGDFKWRLRSDKMEEVRLDFGQYLNLEYQKVNQVPQTDSVIPRELVVGTRDYIEEVVRQINGSYDVGYFDACGVMIRRLIETLIIEAFEAQKIQSKIKGGDGNYFMLEKLISATLADPKVNLGRNAKKGLNDAKWLGDQSAHSRRFLALQNDIDRIQPNIRILSQELVTIAGLLPKISKK